MNIDKLKDIINKPLPKYVEFKDWIVFIYQGSNIKFLFDTVFLSIVVKNNSNFKVGINCKNEYKNFIPYFIKYFEFDEIKVEIPGIYKITQSNHLRANHIELAKSLGIKFPLDLKNPFVDNSIKPKKSVIIACNGIKELSLPEDHEKYIYKYFNSHGYTSHILYIPDYCYKNCWSKSIAIKPLNFQEIINIIQSSEIIIATDNCYLYLANTFLDKKVIGIFGPTKPRSFLYYNSMKMLQIIDENTIKDPRIKKSCPCEDPKFCHRGYKSGDYTYCLSSISPDILIEKIKKLL